MDCPIVDDTISFFRESIKEKIEETRPYFEAIEKAAINDDFELINDQTYILVNLILEIHSRVKALGFLEEFKENYQCE